jgi:hypothetical protein
LSSLEEIIAGFVTTLAPISGLRPTGDDKNFNPPAVIVRLSSRTSGSFGGSGGVQLATFELVVCVGANTPIEYARAAINGYLDATGSTSIEAALRADTTLHETVDEILDISIQDGQAWGTSEINGVPYPSGVMEVEVIY